MSAPLAPFDRFPALKTTLPPLVRKQRRLEKKMLPLKPLIEQDKDIRGQIDARLVAAGFTLSNTGVTCLGYDVKHNTRKGNTTLNTEAAEILLVLGGVDPEFVDFVLTTCTETGKPSAWASVEAPKGATVRV